MHKKTGDFPLDLKYTQGKSCALLNSVENFIEIQGCLVMAFFIYLHNQLSVFNSFIVQMSKKRDS